MAKKRRTTKGRAMMNTGISTLVGAAAGLANEVISSRTPVGTVWWATPALMTLGSAGLSLAGKQTAGPALGGASGYAFYFQYRMRPAKAATEAAGLLNRAPRQMGPGAMPQNMAGTRRQSVAA